MTDIDNIVFDDEHVLWEEISATEEYEFSFDTSGKKILKNAKPDDLVNVINELYNMSFPPGCTLDFMSTEHQQFTGKNKYLLGDLVIEIKPPKGYKTPSEKLLGIPLNWKKLEPSYIVALELQTSEDNSSQEEIGYRLNMYTINAIEKRFFKLKKKKRTLYVVPKGATIYAVAGMPESGIDEVYIQYDRFRVRDHKFSADKGDVLVLEFPYINLLGMDITKLNQSVYNIFLIFYLYKFRQKPKLMLTQEFEQALMIVEQGLANFKGEHEEYAILLEVYQDLHHDLRIALKRQDAKDNNPNNDYRKVVDVMQQVRLTYGEQKVKDFYDKVAQQMQEQMEEQKKQQMQEKEQIKQQMQEQMEEQKKQQMREKEQMKEQMEQKQKEQQLEEKKSTAKKLFGQFSDEQISFITELSIEEVRAIRLEVEGKK